MNKLKQYLNSRLKQKNTYAGVSAIFIAISYELFPTEAENIIHYCSVISGLYLMLIKKEEK
jgi:hypothetical protein